MSNNNPETLKTAIISALAEPNAKRLKSNRQYITRMLNDEREHETKMAFLQLVRENPYFVGASVGLGATWASTFIPKEEKPEESTLDKVSNWYEDLLGIGSPVLSAMGLLDFNQDDQGGLAGNIFSFATGSYTAFCMTCCILQAASGGEEGGMFKSLVGL